MHPCKSSLRLAFLFLACSASAIDDNANGLSDVWEQQFNASALELLQDTDYDGFNNLEECIAGTDPFNAQDLPSLRPDFVQDAAGEMQISFQTVGGKHYSVNHSTELSQFAPINKGWIGDGAVRELTIRKDGRGESVSPIRADFWANLPGTDMDALDALSNYPHAPDGSVHTYYPEAPRFAASHYGARIHFWITPPEDGSYTFYLSAGGPAELYWIDDSANKIAEILPLQQGLQPGEWDSYGTQRAEPLVLNSGEHYPLELHYVSTTARQHAEIAWSGPGLDGIQNSPELTSRGSRCTPKRNHSTSSSSTITIAPAKPDYCGPTTRLWSAHQAE